MKRALWGGPSFCPTGPCSECGPFPPSYDVADLEAFLSAHHFSTAIVQFAEDELDEDDDEAATAPEPATLGHEAWYKCKHCAAWVEASVLPDDEAGEEDAL
ncbi:MAG TPA: hypothetical protein VMY76_00765 [Gemmatimonadales bacterium]|nr:hypothetical protein [Gemmatimonadales bacterium]